ncbi:MAG: hypothetical protein ACOC83_09565 [Gemmatimonadota bacterium]
MNGRKLAATILIAFVALACGEQGQQGQMDQEQGQADQQQRQMDQQQMEGSEEQAASDTQEASQSDQENRVELSAKNESGITGTAGWAVESDSVQFTLRLKALESGQEYPAHVHEGDCDSGGGVAVGLEPVAGGEGGGQGEATVARSNFSAGQTYFVQVHLPDGTPAACGDLPEDAGLAPDGGQD